MIDEIVLRESLKKLLAATEADIRARVEEEPELKHALEARHRAAAEAGRVSPGSWLEFRDETITQAAVHWLLGCVFVRFLEDNDLVDEVRLSGPKTGHRDRLNEALDRRSLWYQQNPHSNDAGYLLQVFAQTAELPGMAGLFHRAHNPLWSLGPTGTQAMAILQFFQDRDDASSELRYDFTDVDLNTRFLGDLYQNLSTLARKRYALCQTPSFVVDFILDRTLTPALDVFGLEKTRLIDPTCGSGHFLLAAFDRLFARWVQREQNANPRVLAQRALDSLYGVDLNPFAVEIAEFRLLFAALRVCRIKRLKDAPNFSFQLATGDSLLHGKLLGRERAVQYPMGHDPASHYFIAEDEKSLERILKQQYQVVVGNPPYINVEDAALRDAYRERYGSCHGAYQLSVPFTERFFDLADAEGAGWVGLIVSNAFATRSFGRKLVEQYLPRWDLTHLVDTSGAHLPDHGTPTLMLFGRHRRPTSDLVRTVRGIRGEIVRPTDPSQAPVWSAITHQIDEPGSQSAWVSVSDSVRSSLASHPWSMAGGGAAELRQKLESVASSRLSSSIVDAGFGIVTREDEVYTISSRVGRRHRVEAQHMLPLIEGGHIREWTVAPIEDGIWPYNPTSLEVDGSAAIQKFLYPWRPQLSTRVAFGLTQIARGLRWFEYSMFFRRRFQAPKSIAYAEIATHNHFVFDNGNKAFKQTAPVLKLPMTANDIDHIALVGLLNSSLACFWLKQVCYNKGSGGISEGLKTEKWEQFMCFNVSTVQEFPLPKLRPHSLACRILSEAQARTSLLPEYLSAACPPTAAVLADARIRAATHLDRMISLQEELDWQAYHLYALLDEDISVPPEELPAVKLGQRAFEIALAREMAAGNVETAWFERHGSSPTTELPDDWPEQYRRAVERRLEIIATNVDVALIERPEYKRRWNLPEWGDLERQGLEIWLLDRMEAIAPWADLELRSCSRLADLLRRDPGFRQVAEIAEGRPDYDVAALVQRLILKQAVPFLPVLRYKPSGLEKRGEWEKAWELQRREDAGERVEISIPPKYRSADFQDATWWNLRGSLDVPKERFILYPGLEGISDSSPVVGWAGWDHLQQAQALNGYYQHAKDDEAWSIEQLKPMLAGLVDLLPWLKQWHNEPNENGDRMGDTFEAQVEAECRQFGITVDSLKEWMPTRTSRAGRRRG